LPAATEDEFVLYIIFPLFLFFKARFDARRYGTGAVIDALDSGAIGEGADRSLLAGDMNT
jgi:hypothetical protein